MSNPHGVPPCLPTCLSFVTRPFFTRDQRWPQPALVRSRRDPRAIGASADRYPWNGHVEGRSSSVDVVVASPADIAPAAAAIEVAP
jgi:hypothetical protein